MDNNNYLDLLNKITHQSLLTTFQKEMSELGECYIAPQPHFITKGDNFLDNAFGGNPFIVSDNITNDVFDISSVLLSNGQAQVGEFFDRNNTFSNNECARKYSNGRLTTKENSLSFVTDMVVNGNIGDAERLAEDDIINLNNEIKFADITNTIYTAQGKRIRVSKNALSVHSKRHNSAFVVTNEEIKALTIEINIIKHDDKQEYLFINRILVPNKTPKHVINYFSSQQFMYKLVTTIQDQCTTSLSTIKFPQGEMDKKIRFNKGLLSGKYFNNMILGLNNKESYTYNGFDCNFEFKITKYTASDLEESLFGRLPDLMLSRDESDIVILNGYEICNSNYQNTFFEFLEYLERNNSIVYDHPRTQTRIIVDTIMNQVFKYYDNLRFTPYVESIYVRYFPALYTVTSSMYNLGVQYTECDTMLEKLLVKITDGNEDADLNTNKMRMDYIKNVYSTITFIHKLYAHPTHRKYTSNKMLAFLHCGSFNNNINKLTNLAARTGFDVVYEEEAIDSLVSVRNMTIPVKKQSGTGVVNHAVGYINLTKYKKIVNGVERTVNDIIQNPERCKTLSNNSQLIQVNKENNDFVINPVTGLTFVLNENSRTVGNKFIKGDEISISEYRKREGYHLFELDSILTNNSNNAYAIGANISPIYIINSIIEGLLFSMTHNPNYGLLSDFYRDGAYNSTVSVRQFSVTLSECSVPKSTRKLLWWSNHLDQNPISSRLDIQKKYEHAGATDLISFNEITKRLYKQQAILVSFCNLANKYDYFSTDSTYFKSLADGFVYSQAQLIKSFDSGQMTTEYMLVAKSLMQFAKSNRQLIYNISILFNTVHSILTKLQISHDYQNYLDEIKEELEYQSPKLFQDDVCVLKDEILLQFLNCIYKNESVYENQIILSGTETLQKILIGDMQNYIVGANSTFSHGNLIALNSPFVSNMIANVSGRLGYTKESNIITNGAKGTAEYINNCIKIEFENNHERKYDIKCTSFMNRRRGTIVPVVKTF